MRRNWLLALGLATTTALGGAIAIPALAHDPGDAHGHETRGSGGGMMGGDHDGMMEMMQRMHGQGTGGMMGGMRDGGMMGGMGPTGGGMMDDMTQAFDADDDGTVTPDELRTGLEGRLSEYDADGDGSLSIEEFEALHSAMIREHMVDRFQHLDNDGDGEVTAEEITAPADRMQRMQQRREQMMQSAPGRTPERGPAMMQDGDADDMIDSGMMPDGAADQ